MNYSDVSSVTKEFIKSKQNKTKKKEIEKQCDRKEMIIYEHHAYNIQ